MVETKQVELLELEKLNNDKIKLYKAIEAIRTKEMALLKALD